MDLQATRVCGARVFTQSAFIFRVFINLSRDFRFRRFSPVRRCARIGQRFALSVEMALQGRAAADDPTNP